MTKRTTASVLAITLGSALMLAGCSGSGAASGSSELTILYGYSNESDQGAVKKIIANYEKANPDIKITGQGLVIDKFYPALQTRVSADNAPDVVVTPIGAIPSYASMGVLADISGYLSKDALDGFSETRLTVDEQDGKLAGLPMADSVRAVIYNKTAFDKAGITVPGPDDDPWTWDELEKAARTVQEKGGVQYGLQFEKPSMDGWLPFLYQAGGSLFDSSGKPSINNAAGVKALTWTRNLYTEGLAAPGVVEGTVDPLKNFQSGQVGLWLSGGSYQVPVLESAEMGFDWGATLLPQDEKATTLIGGSDFIAFDGDNVKQAAKFIEFAATPDQMVIYDNSTASLPPREGVTTTASKRPDVLEMFAAQQKVLDPTLNSQLFTSAYAGAKDGMLRELQSVIIGEVTPQEGADRMADALKNAG